MKVWHTVIISLLAVLLGGAVLVMAQDMAQTTPALDAETLRQRLFDAQVALLNADTETAQAAVVDASALYDSALSAPIAQAAPQIDAQIRAGLDDAGQYAAEGNALGLAAARGMVWTGLLNGSSEIIYAAVATQDSLMAVRWLPLREFRAATRFSRPAVGATLAVDGLSRAVIAPENALAAVRADLLDTYQAQLNSALQAADNAHASGFALRRAEEVGLAAGYFEILTPAYAAQYGEDALQTAQTAFDALLAAAVSGDAAAFADTRAAVDTALAGFRAAPLSETDLARRAGQITRFTTLIGVEYGRGVRGGVIVNDIEIQEALTFYEGAAAAFSDLQPALRTIDPAVTEQIGALLAAVPGQIRAVVDPAELQASVNQINALLTEIMPPAWLQTNPGGDLDVILSILDQVATAVASGDYAAAESARLEAYALLELGIEQRLVGFAPELAVRIESLFWQGTGSEPGLAVLLANGVPVDELRATLDALNSAFDEARLVLGAGQSAPAAVVSNAAVIVFREGLEAVVILASLLASLRTAEARRFRRPLLAGAGLALLATAITWWIANGLLTVLLPLGETLEAIVSLIAIGVLLLITNWFFHKVYWTGWMANFHARKRHLLGGLVAVSVGQMLGLVLLGFTSIYREGFETVLFLQSLVLDAGIPVVLQGVALGLIGTAIVGVITFSLQVRLPYRKMLVVTGVMIGAVLLTMVGHTVHVMQSIGWLPITPVNGLYLPFWIGQWLGVFATWQGLLLQAAAAAFVIGSYFLAEQQKKRQRDQHRVVPQQSNVKA